MDTIRGKPEKLGMVLVFLFFLSTTVYAQESILTAYERNFIRANLAAKAGVLRDAATDEKSAEFIGSLYGFALDFILQNAEVLQDDPDMISLTVLAARGVGAAGHRESLDKLWRMFLAFQDTLTRVEVLGALTQIGGGNPQVTENLNQFLVSQNSLFLSGGSPDYPALSACIAALAALGDHSSFPVLFSVLTAGYPDAIAMEASSTLEVIPGDYKQFLIEVMRKNPPAEKLIAFRAGARNRRFTDLERGELAETALEMSLDMTPVNPESEAIYLDLRYLSVPVLTELKWTRATTLAAKHFYRARIDYENGVVPKGRFLEAISCLGAMGNSEAAQVLALQLGFLNSRMEQSGESDEAVVFAIVNALGEIGDKSSFDYLLYISYLSYPEYIQTAARDALNRLKW
ncbi:MAG: HEAT repeat domain-containing protein [Spirochaetaceae bacterium]|jgi:HEAT repeat protein|nr:HEAT repeat domain-containing protein [Spirochaetaceae bacterium]